MWIKREQQVNEDNLFSACSTSDNLIMLFAFFALMNSELGCH